MHQCKRTIRDSENCLKSFPAGGRKKASEIAAELVDLNAQRKDMTAEGVELAMQQVEEGNTGEKVLVVYLPDVHESLAGIIAGRIREACHKPTFVLTKSEDGVKGSGRSIEAYSMYEELCKCQGIIYKIWRSSDGSRTFFCRKQM